MLFQQKLIVLCLFAVSALLCAAMRPGYNDYKTKWVVLKECTVTVNGSTNINRFTCSIAGYSTTDTLICTRKNNNPAVAMTGKLALPVADFDCVNTMMTRDLRKTLNSVGFPFFYIQFISLEKYPALTAAHETISGTVNIELAGVKKQLTIRYTIFMNDKGIIELEGTQSINFSDFNLVAPRKLGGMIKTNDRLDVAFTIYCRVINV